MSSYRQILYQIIFATKYRKPTLNEENCDALYKYMYGTIKNKNCTIYQINGIEDHIHIACDLHPTVALADLIKDIKVSSSIWMKSGHEFPLFESWGDGYAAFTYTFKDKDRLINYIKNQKEHHKKMSFTDEFKLILREHGIDFDERYLP